MPTPLIYKCRERNPRGYVKGELSSALPTNQWAHKYVTYMGRRQGVITNNDLGHGLFGKLDHNNGGNFGNIDNISAAANYVKKKVEDGTYLYDNIISIAREDFMRLGYDTQEAWRQLAKDNAHRMAEKVGIPSSKLEYVAAVHIENEKPNFHLLFWNKEQGIKPRFNYTKTFSSIRSDIIKYVYEDELLQMATVKNLARDTAVGDTDDFFKDFFKPFREMTSKDYESMVEEIEKDPEMVRGRLLNRDIPYSVLDDFAIMVIQLKEKLPKTGRLSYGFLPPDLKQETEDIIRYLVNLNPDFKKEFEEYIEVSMELELGKDMESYSAFEAFKKAGGDLASYYSTNPEVIKRAEEKAEADIVRRMSNKLLDEIKNLNKDLERDLSNKATRRNMGIGIMSSLFRILSQSNRKAQARAVRLPAGGTERIEGRRDLRKNLEHGSSWGR